MSSPSSPKQFYLQELLAGDEESSMGGEETTASVLSFLYEDLENEAWVEGGPNSPAAALARKNVILSGECTCGRCCSKEKVVVAKKAVTLGVKSPARQETGLLPDGGIALDRTDSMDLLSDDGEVVFDEKGKGYTVVS